MKINKKRIEAQEYISKTKLKELYDAVSGRMSHYVFLDSEPKDFIELLKREDYIKFVKNSSEKKMYTITEKLIRLFREVSEVEEKQLLFDKNKKEISENLRELENIDTTINQL